MTDVYLRLDYKQYKALEQQLREWESVETTHISVDGYYHKALRLDIGDVCLEVQGPAVKAPIREEDTAAMEQAMTDRAMQRFGPALDELAEQ
jgi:hypothetical protein